MEKFVYEPRSHYNEEMIQILKRVTEYFSFTTKIPIRFNDEIMNFVNIKDEFLFYLAKPHPYSPSGTSSVALF
jgi:hypothetical protein